jgi:hypothetical protein
MTGIVAAISGGLGGLTFAAGLYGPFGADPLPATASATSVGGSTVTINYTWLGYLRPSVSGTNNMTINSFWDQFTQSFFGQRTANWGGSPSSVSRLWVGANAISGFTTGNANATSNDGSASYSPTLTAGVNYPVRYNWQASLPYSATAYLDPIDDNFYPGWTTGSCSFSVSNGTGFYNSTTNGF